MRLSNPVSFDSGVILFLDHLCLRLENEINATRDRSEVPVPTSFVLQRTQSLLTPIDEARCASEGSHGAVHEDVVVESEEAREIPHTAL